MDKHIFDFAAFSKIEEKKVEEVGNQQGNNYVYMIMLEKLSTHSINFDMFTLEDIEEVIEELEGIITDEDREGNVSLDPHHPYTKMWSLLEKIGKMGRVPKHRPASPFQFL